MPEFRTPPLERSRISALTFAGKYRHDFGTARNTPTDYVLLGVGLGGVIGFPFSAALCNSEMGWPLVFYVFGMRFIH